jgi:hypothetical protein
MPKADDSKTNTIDPRILHAAQELADRVVQPAIEERAASLALSLGERPSVVATALSETLYRLVLREDTTRWFAMAAEQEHGYGAVETRSAIGRLAGYSSWQGIERRLGLSGNVRRGRHNFSPRELADAVIVDRARRSAEEDAEVEYLDGLQEDPETPRGH